MLYLFWYCTVAFFVVWSLRAVSSNNSRQSRPTFFFLFSFALFVADLLAANDREPQTLPREYHVVYFSFLSALAFQQHRYQSTVGKEKIYRS